jgi:uncharacterized membrane protein
MVGQALAPVFANAALPQKVVLAALAAAVPALVVAAWLALADPAHGRLWRRLIAECRLAGPALGLLVGAMNSFHMGHTIMRAQVDPSAKQLAPGLFEVSTLVGLGALVGLVAVAAHLVVGWAGGEGHGG